VISSPTPFASPGVGEQKGQVCRDGVDMPYPLLIPPSRAYLETVTDLVLRLVAVLPTHFLPPGKANRGEGGPKPNISRSYSPD